MGQLDPTSDLGRAVEAACNDHEAFGDVDDGTINENGAMRAVGIRRAEALALAIDFAETYMHSLVTGWDCPECGADCLPDGTCPEGHEFDNNPPEARRLETLLVTIELALSAGVHLERERMEQLIR